MKKIINNITFNCLYGTLYVISLIPIQILYKVSNIIYILLVHSTPYRKNVVIQNLSRSFPNKNYKEIESIMKKFYHSFCDNLIEIFKTISISPDKQAKKISLINFDIAIEQIAKGKNVIACMGHCGNWEILNVLPYVLGTSCHAIYKPLKSDIINRLFIKMRSRFGMQLVPSKSAARHFISNKDNPSIYLFISDQCPKTVDVEYKFNFLNQNTSSLSGIEKLAQATNSPVVYMHVIKTSRGKYRIECKTVSTDSKSTKKTDIMQQYTLLLEQNIEEQPHTWLWTHKRWKR